MELLCLACPAFVPKFLDLLPETHFFIWPYLYICFLYVFQLNTNVIQQREPTLIEEEEEGEEVEGLGQAETYSEYMPAKCK